MKWNKRSTRMPSEYDSLKLYEGLHAVSERRLRTWLREKAARSDAALSWIEPTAGSSFGVPDALVAWKGGEGLIPFELKKGKLDATGAIQIEVRPVQVLWHEQFAAYTPTYFLVIVKDTSGQVVIVLLGSKAVVRYVREGKPIMISDAVEFPYAAKIQDWPLKGALERPCIVGRLKL